MKREKRFAKFLITVLILLCYSLNGIFIVSAADNSKAYTNEEIIREVAYSYFRQGGQIHYDQLNNKRFITASPEDATEQKQLYLDCSSYVNSCYYEAFGVDVMPFSHNETEPVTRNLTEYAKNNPKAVDVVGYWENADYKTKNEQENLLKSVKKMLKVGDVLVYIRNKTLSGHTMIYVGDDMFLHCTGSDGRVNWWSDKAALSYERKASEDVTGAILEATVDSVFADKDGSRYLFIEDESKAVHSFCILRPLGRGLIPTEKSKNRMTVAGLSMEKTSSIAENGAVVCGDIITYTIKLENTSAQAISDVVFTDTLYKGTEFVSGSEEVFCENENISWKGNIDANKAVTLRYNVKITETVPGTIIVNDSSYINGVKLNKITHTVSGFEAEDITKLIRTAQNFTKNEKAFDNNLKLAQELYQEALGINIFDYSNVSEVLDYTINKATSRAHTETFVSKMLVPNLYGGYDIFMSNVVNENSEQTRLLSEDELSVGDIVIADTYWTGYWKGNFIGDVIYIYIGNSTLLTVENGVAKTVNIGLDIYGEDADNILVALPAYSRFAVLRPSMIDWENVKEDNLLLYTDIKKSDWYYPYVEFATVYGLLDGKTDSLFMPDEKITRAMFVEALYRMENKPEIKTDIIPFKDVKNDAGYKNAVLWANENNIVNGVTDTEFMPDADITREQFSAVIYRYAKFKNANSNAEENEAFSSFKDFNDISDYAKDGLLYAYNKGIITGFTDNTLLPKANTTKAQASAILMRIYNLFNPDAKYLENAKEDFEVMLGEVERFFNNLENSDEYKFDEAFINEFKNVYENVKAKAQNKLSHFEVSSYLKELKAYLKKSAYYQELNYDQIDVFDKTRSWTHTNGGVITHNDDGTVTFTTEPEKSSQSTAEVNTKNSVLTFRIKFDDIIEGKYRGIYFKYDKRGKGYLAVVKNNKLEFQGVDRTLYEAPNFIVEKGKWYTMECGAINAPTGVLQYWKIDGNVVFAKLDLTGAQTRTEGKIWVQHNTPTHFEKVEVLPEAKNIYKDVLDSFNNPVNEGHLSALLTGANDFIEIDDEILKNVNKNELAKALYEKVISKEIQISEDGDITAYKNAVLEAVLSLK